MKVKILSHDKTGMSWLLHLENMFSHMNPCWDNEGSLILTANEDDYEDLISYIHSFIRPKAKLHVENIS